MHKLLRCLLFLVLAAGTASTALAGELTLTIADGRVTVIAKEVPLRQILAEWARVGNTRMVNAEKLVGAPLTLQLIDVPEKEALDILLRSAAGYVTASREIAATGASAYDRVIILATSRPPVGPVTPPPQPFNRPAIPQPMPQPQPEPAEDDDDGEPMDQGQMPPPGLQNPGMPFPGPTPATNNPAMNPGNPAMPPTAPLTAPRPGMLPPPQQGTPVNPYAPMPPVGPGGRPLPGPGGRGAGPGGQGGQDIDDHF